MTRTLLAAFAAIAAIAALTAGTAQAGAIQPFTQAALKSAQAKGLPVLVDAHADWCPTCRAQAPTIAAIAQDPAFARLVILKLDYDKQIAEKRELNVRQQSTLITFKGTKETGRSVGVTDPAEIRALAAAAVR